MTLATGLVLTSLITTTPALIAVTVAVFSRDSRRRADARLTLRILRPMRQSRAGSSPRERDPRHQRHR